MRVSFLLRLDPTHLAHGDLVGEIEEVMTGQIGGVKSSVDVVSFCAAVAGGAAGATGASSNDHMSGGSW